MKTFVVLVLTVVALFVWQRGNPGKTSSANPAPTLATTPLPPPPSGPNWVKNSFDRTHEAIGQVRQMRQESERP